MTPTQLFFAIMIVGAGLGGWLSLFIFIRALWRGDL